MDFGLVNKVGVLPVSYELSNKSGNPTHHLAALQQLAADKAVTMGHIKRSHMQKIWCAAHSFELVRFEFIDKPVSKQIELQSEIVSLTQLSDILRPKTPIRRAWRGELNNAKVHSA